MATFNWLSVDSNDSSCRAGTDVWSAGAFNNFNNYVYKSNNRTYESIAAYTYMHSQSLSPLWLTEWETERAAKKGDDSPYATIIIASQ